MTDAPYRRLLRPLDDRIVAGVCSGIGRYFGVDPVLIRVAFIIFAAVTWGAALIAYPVVWFLIPEEPAPAPPTWRDPSGPQGPGFSAPSEGPGAGSGPAPTWGRPAS